jgi:predicted TPR repeat methyltransferase
MDYRTSHEAPGKGESYHASFSEDPYRRLIWDLEKRILDRVARDQRSEGRLRHLDFACGTGRVLSHLAAAADESVGVDVSASMLAVARAAAGRSEIVQADLTRSDVLGERRFDLITAFRFFPNAEPSLRSEAMRVLAKHLAGGGRLVFNDHRNASSLQFRLARLRRRGGFDGMTLDEARELIAAHGLEVERVQALGFNPLSDEHPVLPAAWLRPVESLLSRWGRLWRWGSNVIFVCRKAGAREAQGRREEPGLGTN